MGFMMPTHGTTQPHSELPISRTLTMRFWHRPVAQGQRVAEVCVRSYWPARTAGRSGVATVIANGRDADVLSRIIANPAGPGLGTAVPAERSESLTARRRWLATRQPRGVLTVDAGAAQALVRTGS